MRSAGTEEIARGVYWVGGSEQDGGLHCNPYLIVDGEEAVLIDPGSVLDFHYVYENVCSIVPLEKVKYVILHHQDPDFCASVPLFEQKGAEFKIVTHWRTQTLVKYYGVRSEYYIVNENEFRLKLQSGRVLGFVQTPYLHFPGAIATYDYDTKTLFSSDLFGAFSLEWSLYADDNYMEKMKTFHEHYMPSNDILRPVMEILLSMDIAMIAPQHGSVIRDRVQEYIKALRDLECGLFLEPVRKDIARSGGYRFICSTILKRYASVFKKEEVLDVLEEMDVTLDRDTLEITDYNYKGTEIWNKLFEHILAQKGISWLFIIEPLVKRLSKEYDLPMPEVFVNTLIRSQEQADSLNRENAMLREVNSRLGNSVKQAEEKLLKCPVTGLYNEEFFRNYLYTNIRDLTEDNSDQNPALIIVEADNIARIKYSYGDAEVDQVLKNIVYIMNGLKEENTNLFRLQGASFAVYVPHTTREKAVVFAEAIRNAVYLSETFIERMTVSIGVCSLDELTGKGAVGDGYSEQIIHTAVLRLRLARDKGMNMVCSNSTMQDYRQEAGKILIIDTDEVNIDVLSTFLENMNYRVVTAADGEEALLTVGRELPDLILSEIMLPKFDGFLIREKLLAQSETKNIPFIFLSHMKNDDSVQRAASLEVEHYFRKPYMLSELIGLIRIKIKGDASV